VRATSSLNLRVSGAILHDCLAVVAAWIGTYLLRFGTDAMWSWLAANAAVLAVVGLVQVAVFAAVGLYRGFWRYASLRDLRQLLLAVAIAAVAAPVVQSLLAPTAVLPRSTLILHPLLLLMFMGGGRFAYRLWRDSRDAHQVGAGEPVLVAGAGAAGARLVEQLHASARWRAVAFVDDDPRKLGRVIHGVRVLGVTADAPELAQRLQVRTVVMALPGASHEVRRAVLDACRDAGLEVLTVPSVDEMLDGGPVDRIRKVEIDDLLGRDPVTLDDAGVGALLTGKVVMVTGAGGSIGSELCRQIARFQPALLLLLDSSEYALYRLVEDLRARSSRLQWLSLVGDVRDRTRVAMLLAQYRPSVVFHAAAYKHVPMMEDLNAWEAVRNNALGTHVIATAAVEQGVETFVLVSTDKAVNPTNVMGASKRLAEIVCEALQSRGRTRFEIVRFGNVLGSTGSVIPKFQEQIARGGPVTITHPEIIRFFMSIPEAAQLVLQAGTMGQGGEIFVLDMGKPIRIVELARELIRLSGLSESSIPIVFTGLRPGEKLYEELLADGETTLPTRHPKLRIASSRGVDPEAFDALVRWISADTWRSDAEVRRELRRWLPEYAPPDRREFKVIAGGAQSAAT
jgi:FlaA1/EpsC-like NDP-sugar epimerase